MAGRFGNGRQYIIMATAATVATIISMSIFFAIPTNATIPTIATAASIVALAPSQ